MTRLLMVGLPRSGTTWLAQTLASAPGVRYVHEPDNAGLTPFAHLAHAGLPPFPYLRAADTAPPDYELLWSLVFRGSSIPDPHPLAVSPRTPRRLRIALARRAARAAVKQPAYDGPVLAKTVRAFLASEWLAHRFDPAVIVVWRHPVNLTAGWRDQGWTTAEAARRAVAVEERFAATGAWPPPAEEGAEATTWAICALSVLLLEQADRHASWVVSSHEQACVDPARHLLGLLEGLRLEGDAAVAETLADLNRPGSGFETKRLTAEEPSRWRKRLSAEEAATAWAVVDRFATESPVAARHWAAAPVGDRDA